MHQDSAGIGVAIGRQEEKRTMRAPLGCLEVCRGDGNDVIRKDRRLNKLIQCDRSNSTGAESCGVPVVATMNELSPFAFCSGRRAIKDTYRDEGEAALQQVCASQSHPF